VPAASFQHSGLRAAFGARAGHSQDHWRRIKTQRYRSSDLAGDRPDHQNYTSATGWRI